MPAQQVIEQVLKSGYMQVTQLEARYQKRAEDGLPCRSQDGCNHLRKARWL